MKKSEKKKTILIDPSVSDFLWINRITKND